MAPTEAAPTSQPAAPVEGVSSFAKSLFLGEIHEELVFPFPRPGEDEQRKVRELNAWLRDYAAEAIDPRAIEEAGWVGDELIRDLGERGFCGLYVPEEYGGQGLSQTGYCRVFETIAQTDASLSVVLGVHQSIGYKGIALFGSDEQKARLLPDLAAGRRLAGFALTEPEAGSDAYNLQTRAVRQPDGSWRLNGEKRWIGNGSKGSVLVTFARAEVGGKDRHIALIVERGMDGFEVGKRYDTMGLRGNDLRHLYFRDVRVPKENVLGEPGEGFRIAMQVLNNGRLSLGTGSVGAAKGLLDSVIDHVKERRQFGRPLADFELVQDKIGWMVSYLFGLESLAYLTTGLVDKGVPDYSLESAICKVAGTEFLWYQANRALQLKGGAGYMRDEPYEKVLRDTRIFPIFEGANDVLRAFIALTGMKPLGDELSELADVSLADPDRLARRARRLHRRPGGESGTSRADHHGRSRARPARRLGLRAGRSAARGYRVAAARTQGRHRRAPVPTETAGKRCIRHLRTDRRAVASHRPPQRARRARLGPGALHLRDVLHPRRSAGQGRARPGRAQRRRTHGGDRQARLQARGLRLRLLRGLTKGGRL